MLRPRKKPVDLPRAQWPSWLRPTRHQCQGCSENPLLGTQALAGWDHSAFTRVFSERGRDGLCSSRALTVKNGAVQWSPAVWGPCRAGAPHLSRRLEPLEGWVPPPAPRGDAGRCPPPASPVSPCTCVSWLPPPPHNVSLGWNMASHACFPASSLFLCLSLSRSTSAFLLFYSIFNDN